MADEPTGDLDRKSAEEILDLLEQLNREFSKTIVMVTHDPRAAQRAGRILHLDKGKLVGDVAARGPDRGRVMKFLTYIFRNARRNPIRSFLTIASTSISLFLMMILVTFFAINDEVSSTLGVHNRIVTMNSQGFAGVLPITRVAEVAAMDGVVAATPFSWYGGKYGEETMPFAQFGVDPDTIFTIYDEFKVPPDQLKAFQEDRAGCVVGRKLAEDRGWKVGDPLPLEGGHLPLRPQPDDPGDLRRAGQSRPADVHVPLGLPRRGPEARRQGRRGPGTRGSSSSSARTAT